MSEAVFFSFARSSFDTFQERLLLTDHILLLLNEFL